LFWRSGPGRTTGSFKGPAVCLGQYRSLVVGFQGGHLITAHVSRCLLYRRGLHPTAVDSAATATLPSVQDRALESAIDPLAKAAELDLAETASPFPSVEWELITSGDTLPSLEQEPVADADLGIANLKPNGDMVDPNSGELVGELDPVKLWLDTSSSPDLNSADIRDTLRADLRGSDSLRLDKNARRALEGSSVTQAQNLKTASESADLSGTSTIAPHPENTIVGSRHGAPQADASVASNKLLSD
jgi:hypothetical protein